MQNYESIWYDKNFGENLIPPRRLLSFNHKTASIVGGMGLLALILIQFQNCSGQGFSASKGALGPSSTALGNVSFPKLTGPVIDQATPVDQAAAKTMIKSMAAVAPTQGVSFNRVDDAVRAAANEHFSPQQSLIGTPNENLYKVRPVFYKGSNFFTNPVAADRITCLASKLINSGEMAVDGSTIYVNYSWQEGVDAAGNKIVKKDLNKISARNTGGSFPELDVKSCQDGKAEAKFKVSETNGVVDIKMKLYDEFSRKVTYSSDPSLPANTPITQNHSILLYESNFSGIYKNGAWRNKKDSQSKSQVITTTTDMINKSESSSQFASFDMVQQTANHLEIKFQNYMADSEKGPLKIEERGFSIFKLFGSSPTTYAMGDGSLLLQRDLIINPAAQSETLSWDSDVNLSNTMVAPDVVKNFDFNTIPAAFTDIPPSLLLRMQKLAASNPGQKS